MELYAVGREPLSVWLGGCKLLLEFSVVVYLALLCIYHENLAWLQTSFLLYVSRIEVHHSHFAGYDHHVVVGDEVACRAQTVAVEHSACKASVAEEEGGWTVPWLHEDGVVLVEGLEVFADGVLVVE